MFYPYYYYYYDPTYIWVLIAAIFSLVVSFRVNSIYNKYSGVRSVSGLTASEAARRILESNGIYDVELKPTRGKLSDRYSPSEKTVYLSDFNSRSIAAIGVAAHECGHVLQHYHGYVPLKLSTAIRPLCAMCSNLGIPILLIGVILGYTGLISLGIILFAVGFLVSVITLPVEYNASNRALKILEEKRLLYPDELPAAKKVLRAAGLTYVAAAVSTLVTLLRLIILSGRRRD